MMQRILTVARRELASYFDHATAYILLVIFLGINFFFFFRDAYLMGEASLRPMFGLLPWLLLFFIPAVSMRSLAEEQRSGTLELVLAQPVSVLEFLLGKFLGVLSFLAVALFGTIGIAVGFTWGADLQWGVIFSQYLGSLFLVATLVAVGLWASSTTRNQVTAFILGVAMTFLLYAVGLQSVVLGLPGALAQVATRIGVLVHFSNVSRGVIDLRDVLYFISVTAAFLALTYFSLMRERLSQRGVAYRRLRLGTLGLVALAIMVSLLGGRIRGRLDLTPGKIYTLSGPTRDILDGLDDLVTIKLFISSELPPEFVPTSRDLEDLIRDFDSQGGDSGSSSTCSVRRSCRSDRATWGWPSSTPAKPKPSRSSSRRATWNTAWPPRYAR
jgi:ABC-2 type transport system permease protein